MKSPLSKALNFSAWLHGRPARQRNLVLACIMAALLAIVGFSQSWNLAFSLLNMCLISAIMSLGVNIQWGLSLIHI